MVSPHKSAFYVREKASWTHEGAKWWYNGGETRERPFPALMDAARRVIEPIVDAAVRSRSPRAAIDAMRIGQGAAALSARL